MTDPTSSMKKLRMSQKTGLRIPMTDLRILMTDLRILRKGLKILRGGSMIQMKCLWKKCQKTQMRKSQIRH